MERTYVERRSTGKGSFKKWIYQNGRDLRQEKSTEREINAKSDLPEKNLRKENI